MQDRRRKKEREIYLRMKVVYAEERGRTGDVVSKS